MSTELKEQLKQELLNQKEEQRKKEIEINSKLTEITLYIKKDSPGSDTWSKNLTEQGIKVKEKDLDIHPGIVATVGMPANPIVYVNGNYLAMGRDFNNPQQLVGALRFLASPDYVAPDPHEQLINLIKNMGNGFSKQLQQVSRQIQPIVKIMNELARDEEAEKKANEIKNTTENAKKNK
jgi:hypothetical protein